MSFPDRVLSTVSFVIGNVESLRFPEDKSQYGAERDTKNYLFPIKTKQWTRTGRLRLLSQVGLLGLHEMAVSVPRSDNILGRRVQDKIWKNHYF